MMRLMCAISLGAAQLGLCDRTAAAYRPDDTGPATVTFRSVTSPLDNE
jgi:hypothetical protein